jgi:hypothetical protein
MLTHIFTQKGDFEAWYAATSWCAYKGISVGSMCRHDPVGLMIGDVLIAKWRNLTAKERSQLDGTITGDFRNGPLTLQIIDKL